MATYSALRDQASTVWYLTAEGLPDDSGAVLALSTSVPPGTNLTPGPPFWLEIGGGYVYPTPSGELVITSVAPALGTGIVFAQGLSLTDADGDRWLVGVSAMGELTLAVDLTDQVYDETYDLGVLAGTDPYALDLPYATEFLLEVGPAVSLIVTPPLILFRVPTRAATVLSMVDVMTFLAPSREAQVASMARQLTFMAEPRLAAVQSTVDLLTFLTAARPGLVTSQARPMTFAAPTRLAGVTSSVDDLTFTAPERPAGVVAAPRFLTFMAQERLAGVLSLVDTLSFTAPSRHGAVVSAIRG